MEGGGTWEPLRTWTFPASEPGRRLNPARIFLHCVAVEGRLYRPHAAFAVVDFNQGTG